MDEITNFDGFEHRLMDYDKVPGMSYVRGARGKAHLVKKTIALHLGKLPKIMDDWKWEDSNVLFFFYENTVENTVSYTYENSHLGELLISEGNEIQLVQDESIEAKVRNRLGPITNLVCLLEEWESMDDDLRQRMKEVLKSNIESVKKANKALIDLGSMCDRMLDNLTEKKW